MHSTSAGATRAHTGRAARFAAVAAATALALTTWAPSAFAADALGDPVLDLSFERDVTDAGPLAHPVTLRGHAGSAPTGYEYVDGVTAGTEALRLTGNTYLDLGTSTALQPEDLTLAFWMQPSGRLSGEHLVTWNKGAYNSDGWYVSSESDTVPLAISIGPASGQPYKVRVASSDRASFFPADEWTHVVVTYDHTTKDVAFYRNGEKVPSTVANATGGDATGVLGSDPALPKTIGFNGPQYNGGYLRAALDEYRVYDDVAGLADVVGLYEESGREIDRDAVARDDADGLSLPERATVALVLPTTGSRGSAVTWQTSDPDVVGADGTVTRPALGEDDAHVTLTARVRYLDGDPVTRTFDVLVPALVDETPLEDTTLPSVLLSDDFLTNAAGKEHEYLLSLDSEKFLYEFYKVGGLTPTTATGYAGWERSNAVNFRGHAFGHYMSALAMSYSSTPDQATKDAHFTEIEEAVSGLSRVQDAYATAHPGSAGYVSAFRESILDQVQGTGTSDENVIVPWYNLHKVLAGLLDVAEYVDGPVGDEALAVATDFGLYVQGRVSQLDDTSVMLRTEYGGMNEALYELFDLTGDVRIKEAAEAFDEVTFFRQLAAGQDVLPGKHANTQIPKLLGALKRYRVFTQNPEHYALLTQAEKDELPMYLAAAENFFDIVVDDHTYVTGANSQAEHFHEPGSLHEHADEQGAARNAETAETCNEYNMLKLSRELFKLSKDVRYADYYENAFINTILSSQNPETGTTTYFNPMGSGYHKVFNLPFTEFWCCTGTGMENFSKLGDSIYYTGQGSVWVNMFFSSTFEHAEQNLRVEQEANLPNDDTVTFHVAALDGGAVAQDATLRLRVPSWAAGDVSLEVNGTAVEPAVSRGYVVVPVAAGDEIRYTMPMAVSVVDTPDNPYFVAFRYGPVVLSADLGEIPEPASQGTGILVRSSTRDEDAQTTITAANMGADEWKERITENLVRVEDDADGRVQLRLRNTADGAGLVFTPHHTNWDVTYGLYLNLDEPDSAASQERILRSKQELRDADRTVDELTSFDNNNFENAKNLKQNGSSVGAFNGRQFRHANGTGWFSYDLMVDPSSETNHLGVTLYTGDAGRTFDVYVNDERLKTVTTLADAPSKDEDGFYVDSTELPAKYLEVGDDTRWKVDSAGEYVLDDDGERIPVVTVRFQATGGWAGGVFGLRLDRAASYDATPGLSALAFDTGTLTPAFDPATTDYTLTVPEGTTSVVLDADPHVPSGLVRVDGVLIDDTQGRVVGLPEDGTARTVEVVGVAQDHETATTYTVEIVPGEVVPEPEVVLDVEVSPRCMAGKAYVAVRATNAVDVPADVTVTTPYGSRSFTDVAPGKAAYQSFAVRASTLAAGEVTVTGAAVLDGTDGPAEVTTSYDVAFDARTC
ncbi:beta-L-arabinofuranosidase domain-containing protein [Cellulosimicrobium arenosum]|uniref:Glycoside hydrolase family 127 protein n=1 Tax=Cellulosimicrobium arenosum TaxID=2708133 RepID=A0A927G9J8_9MICO|nr:beta-L-arabinofuranosidase domain-containing protein [Cellulosimicrobium arenosum]MBD8079466.1 glycoside hydrolase family 127 protein [Cellulosimicrobium arenosum]